MLGKDIHSDFSASVVYFGENNCMTGNPGFSKDLSLENKLEMISEQKDYLLPLCYDTLNKGMMYTNQGSNKFNDSVSSKHNSNVLYNNFGQTEASTFFYNKDSNTSLYGLVPNLSLDSIVSTYSLPNEVPIRLSSPINVGLSSLLSEPSIEKGCSKQKSVGSQDSINPTFSPSSSNGGYESGSPPTALRSFYDVSTTFSSPLVTGVLSSSPVALEGDTSSKRKSPSKSNTSNSGIKRPLNSFMLYRRDKQGSIPTNNHQSISRIIGEMWKRETIKEKERYAEMALRERERHAKEYPDYKFLPRKKKDKAVNGKSPRRRKTHDPVLEQDETKILRMMLNQISHKKSLSDTSFENDRNNSHWLLGDNNSNTSLRSSLFDSVNQIDHTPDLSNKSQLVSNAYECSNSNTMQSSTFPLETRLDNASANHDFQPLINTYTPNLKNESWLGNVFDKGPAESPQNISIYNDVKNIDSLEKKGLKDPQLSSTFDSILFQDDMDYIRDNFFCLWDETADLSSFSTSNPSNNIDLLNCPSFDLVNSGLITIINGSHCSKEKSHD